MKSFTDIRWYLAIVFVLMSGLCSRLNAQTGSQYLYVVYKESVTMDQESPFVRNNLSITNIFSQPLQFTITYSSPEGYAVISQNGMTYELAPGENTIIPLTFSRDKKAKAGTEMAGIDIQLKNPSVKLEYGFKIVNLSVKELRVYQDIQDVMVSVTDPHIELPLRIRNVGNTTQTFEVNYFSKAINLNSRRIKIVLPQQKDTLLVYKYDMPQYFVKSLTKPIVITARIGNDTVGSIYSFKVSKLGTSNKQNKNAYNFIPLTVEGGYLANNADRSYYFGITGAYQFKPGEQISFFYRSKQYGIRSVQNDVFGISLRYHKWDYQLGLLSDSRQFFTSGLGASVGYQKNEVEGTRLTVISNLMSNNSINKNQTAIFTSSYKVKGLLLGTFLSVNQDPLSHTNSAIGIQHINIWSRENLLLRLIGGAGADVRERNDDKKYMVGSTVGYDFIFGRPHWKIMSSVLFNSNNFPGVYKGWRNQTHSADYYFTKKFSAGLFYNSSFTRQNYFIDSVYYDNRYLYNLTNYGARVGFNFKKVALTLGVARTQSLEYSSSTIPEFTSGLFSMNWRIKNIGSLSINSITSYHGDFGQEHQQVLYYANTAVLNTRYGGVNVMYNRMPLVSRFVDSVTLLGYRDVMSITPFMSFVLWHKRINGRLQYSFYQATEPRGVNEMQSVMGTIMYMNANAGVDVTLFGSYVLKSTYTPSNFASLIVRKSLNVPIITNRKFYDLSLILYEDVNGNGHRDANEQGVPNAHIIVNETSLYSGEEGEVRYKNVAKGAYRLDFHEMNNSKGLIPVRGFQQFVTVTGNTKMEIPMNKGKVIKGGITIIFDSLSKTTFSNAYLRVTAIDSSGEKFSTLTDMLGNYQLNVPQNKYIVTLNPDAFDDGFKPVQMVQNANMYVADEMVLNYVIKQRTRKINKIDATVK